MTLENLTIGYKNPLIKNINLTLHSAALTCLVGINGVGKSTLLRTIAGIQKPISGTAYINNVDIHTETHAQLARQVSIVFTDPIPDQLITIAELVATGRMPHTGFLGKLSEKDKNITDSAMQLLNINDIAHRKISEVSDGQRQRALIARAIAQQTPIIILDEPTAFLDFKARIQVMSLLQNLAHADGKTILTSTHEIDLATRFADYLWVATNNEIISGNVHECSNLLQSL